MSLVADKSKAPRLPRVVVHHDHSADNRAKLLKGLGEQIVREVVSKVFDVDVGVALVVAHLTKALLASNENANKPVG